jgi:hypothetical protein
MLALSTLLASKVAAAAAIGAVSLGGVSAVAYTGNLPTPVQNLAHNAVGAPAAHHGRPAGTPKGPDATGKAAFGLCTAYRAAQANGGVDPNSVAFQNLATAAGGAANIVTYCAKVPHPGHAPSTHPSGPPASHSAGPPASHPANPHASHPAGPTASHPAGPPTTAPTHQQPSHPASASTTPSAS